MRRIFELLSLLILSSCIAPKSGLIEEPKHDEKDYIKHFAYSLVYNEKNEQADWVSYQLLASELAPNFERTDKFLVDTMVLTGSADNSDYKNSGYDKGHLAPAADMTWNEQAMMESFYFSNISPQLPGFNRGIWKKLEEKVRDWAKIYDCLYITTGPICNLSTKSIGDNAVMIPTQFYKTILIYNDSIKQSIAFLFPNEKCEGEIFDYVVTVDSIELITRKDFYFALPDRQEKIIEKQVDLSYWKK